MLMTALKSAARTDPGRVRHNNEDAFHLDPDRGIFLVVDGVGGHAAGEKAAAIAVERIRARLDRQTGAPERRIREAIAIANNEILAAARSNPEWDGMACVLTLALIENGTAYIGHVGDSRLYLIRRGEIRKITRDHSPVGEREDAGEIGEAEAMRHPRRNEVFRDVGSEEHSPDDANFIDIERLPFDAETALLLCSDGLSDQVPAEEIRSAVERNAGDPDAAARALIAAANAAGGKDNVTVIIVEGERFTAPPSAAGAKPRRGNSWLIASVIANLALAGGLAYMFFQPPKPPVVLEPRTLTAGAGGAYPSIAAALAAARSGDTVEVLAGEYPEHVFLKSGVTLRSRVAREARLIASPGNNTAVTASGVEHGRFEGFLIAADPRNPLEIGILIANSSVIVANNEIEGAATGVQITGPRAPELTANAIHDCEVAGASMEGLVNPWLFHNSFQRDKTAIAIQGDAKPVLTGNVFEKAPVALPADVPLAPVREHNFLLDLRPPARVAPNERPVGAPNERPATPNRKGKEQ
jgi:PPM family protein phosphatase